MKFTHGSSQEIENNEFKLFDYTVDKNGNISEDKLNNAVDGEGAGIYAFIGSEESNINDAKLYSGENENEGYIYLFSVNIDEEDLMHNRDNAEIPIESWIEGVDYFISELRRIHNVSFDKFEKIIENSEGLSLDEINNKFKSEGLDIEFDDYLDPLEFEDFYDWKTEAEEFYQTIDPAFYILDEGEIQIIEHAIESSDNLYNTLYNIWNSVAISYSQNGISTYNNLFQQSMLMTVGKEYDLTASYVDDGNFAVIFDTSMIEVEKVINLKEEFKEKNEIEDFLNNKKLTNLTNKKNKLKL